MNRLEKDDLLVLGDRYETNGDGRRAKIVRSCMLWNWRKLYKLLQPGGRPKPLTAENDAAMAMQCEFKRLLAIRTLEHAETAGLTLPVQMKEVLDIWPPDNSEAIIDQIEKWHVTWIEAMGKDTRNPRSAWLSLFAAQAVITHFGRIYINQEHLCRRAAAFAKLPERFRLDYASDLPHIDEDVENGDWHHFDRDTIDRNAALRKIWREEDFAWAALVVQVAWQRREIVERHNRLYRAKLEELTRESDATPPPDIHEWMSGEHCPS